MKNIQLDLETLTVLRQELHARPEVSGEEQATAARILAELEKLNPDQIITGLGGHGVAAVFKGKAPGKRVLVRAELDALPIAEANADLPYASIYEGKGHKCGHDGHMTILVGLAQNYAQNRPERGEVVLLFQPSEEDGRGARAVCEDKNFANIKPDYAFALHNLPGEEIGKILCKTGSFSSSVESMIVRITGKTAHAAEPEKALPASAVMPGILNYTNGLNNSDRLSDDYRRVSLVRLISGEEKAYGTTAGDGELHYTIRARTPEKLSALWAQLVENVTSEIGDYNKKNRLFDGTGLRVSFEKLEPFMANINDVEAVALVQRAAELNGLAYADMACPNDWGEDFGYFTNLDGVKGVMFGLGAGKNTPNLHNPHYDFPDQLIPKGVCMFSEMIAGVDHDH